MSIDSIWNSTSTAALAALLLAAAPLATKAADLGGDCCADLEERVAELEATTVRIDRRKVSVTLYGHVNSGLLWYDNGEESDLYVVDTDTSTSRLGVRGTGTIRPGWNAGYKIEIATPVPAQLSLVSENDNDNATDGVVVRHAHWFIESEQLGKVTIGQQSSASDGINDGIGLSGTLDFAYAGPSDWNASFCVIEVGPGGECTGTLWGDVLKAYDPNGRDSAVRYDSPTFAGFTFSASWAEDDEHDLALRYERDWNGFKVSAGAGYNHDADDNNPAIDTWAASVSFKHMGSGLFMVAYYAEQDLNVPGQDVGTNWYLQGGIARDFSGMGETSIYAEYDESDNADGLNSLGTVWGVGIAQDVSAVGATAYLGYRHHQADIINVATEDFDAVLTGMKVRF